MAFVVILIFVAFMFTIRDGYDEFKNDPEKEQMEILYYRNHSYICYKWRNGIDKTSVGGASIVHDPDCKCSKGDKR